MGFFSGLLGGSKTKVPATGFFATLPAYQDLYGSVVGNVNKALPSINSDMFTPNALSPEEQAALSSINRGFTPTQETLGSDIAMQMNPFDQFVIDAINREASGKGSVLNTQLQGAGQSGSNRALLGANDIDLSRLQQIGQFKQGQYSNALQNALTTLTGSRRQDASAQLGAGDFLRNLDLQTKQAPVSALQTQEGLLGGIPTEFGDFGTPQTTVKTGGGLGGLLGGLSNVGSLFSGAGGLSSALGFGSTGGALSGIGSALAMFSDIRLKENIIPLGKENGHNIYEFSYIDSPKRFIGVMAHEVEESNPDAVIEVEGFKAVKYGMIGVEFREAING